MWAQNRRLFGDSLVTIDGEAWIDDRRLLQPLFSKGNLELLAAEMVETIDDALAEMAPRAAKRPLAFNREMAHLAANVVLRSLFGVDLRTDEDRELRAALMQAVAQACSA